MPRPTHQPLPDINEVHLAVGVLPLHFAHSTTKTTDVVFDQQTMRGEHTVTQEPDTFRDRENRVLRGM